MEFCQDGENTWADISNEALVELIDIEGLSNDDIGENILSLSDIYITYNQNSNSILHMSKSPINEVVDKGSEIEDEQAQESKKLEDVQSQLLF